MSNIEQSVKEAFPFKEFRPYQQEGIVKIINTLKNTNKRFVLLDAPTGSGKSAIGITVAKFFNKSFYLTSSKILQDQLMKDFGSTKIQDLKGRNSYECVAYDVFPQINSPKPKEYVSCAEGFCKKNGDSRCSFCLPEGQAPICPYFNQLEKAKLSDICIMNFSSFLFQSMTDNFDNRELMIIDEAHNTESQILSFVSLVLSDGGLDLKIPDYKTAKEYHEWIIKENLIEIVKSKIDEAKENEDIKEQEDWESSLSKIERFINSDPTEWVCEYSYVDKKHKIGKVELKPIFADKYAESCLFKRAGKFLLMSATILSSKNMCETLGITKDNVEYIDMPNLFPVKNRPIFFMPIGSMSFSTRDKTLPKILKKIEEISNSDHATQRGVIHTNSFFISDYIYENCSTNLRKRLFYPKNPIFDNAGSNSREKTLQAFEMSSNGILIGPSWHEGIDLKDDLSRFSIICKVPYPNFTSNKQLEARMKLSKEYYSYITALKLVQSYGRSIRHEEDWAITYVLDSDFGRFISMSGYLLPKWFTEAIEG